MRVCVCVCVGGGGGAYAQHTVRQRDAHTRHFSAHLHGPLTPNTQHRTCPPASRVGAPVQVQPEPRTAALQAAELEKCDAAASPPRSGTTPVDSYALVVLNLCAHDLPLLRRGCKRLRPREDLIKRGLKQSAELLCHCGRVVEDSARCVELRYRQGHGLVSWVEVCKIFV